MVTQKSLLVTGAYDAEGLYLRRRSESYAEGAEPMECIDDIGDLIAALLAQDKVDVDPLRVTERLARELGVVCPPD